MVMTVPSPGQLYDQTADRWVRKLDARLQSGIENAIVMTPDDLIFFDLHMHYGETGQVSETACAKAGAPRSRVAVDLRGKRAGA